MPSFEFTLVLEGVDVLSDESQEHLEQLGVPFVVGLGYSAPGLTQRALRFRGGDFFENALFGRDEDIEYATFRLEAPSEEAAVNWAAAMLVHALPGIRVIGTTPGRLGSVDIR